MSTPVTNSRTLRDATELYLMAVDAESKEDAIEQIATWLEHERVEMWNDGFKEGQAEGRAYGYSEVP